jgi:Outer membrane protein
MKRIVIFTLAVCLPAFGARTLSMREAVELAARLNPDAQIAALRTLEAEASERIAASAYRPQLSALIASAYQTNNLQGIGLVIPGFTDRIGPFRTFNARPALTQTVFDMSLVSTIRAARARTEESRYEAAAVRQETQLAVLQLYLKALQAESTIRAAEARMAAAAASLQQAQDREGTGTSSRLDVVRAEEQYEGERSIVISARRDAAIAKTMIARTIGLEDTDFELVPESVPLNIEEPSAEALIRDAKEVRPEFKALQARLRASEYERQRAERERWPKLTVSGDYGLLGRGPDQSLSTYVAGASITFPLWTSGRLTAEASAARLQADRVKQQIRDLDLKVAQEVRESLLEMEAARDALNAASRGAAAAREALELSRLRYSEGLATSLDPIVAQSILAQAEDREIRARYDYLLARAKLARARGDIMLFFDGDN